jgi:putative transposase
MRVSDHRIIEGTMYRLEQQVWRVLDARTDGLVNIVDMVTGEAAHTTQKALLAAYYAGNLQFCLPNRRSSGATLERNIPQPLLPTIADYPPHVQAIIAYRRWVITPYINTPHNRRTRRAVLDRVAAIKRALSLVPMLLDVQEAGIADGTPLEFFSDIILHRLKQQPDHTIIALALELIALLLQHECMHATSSLLTKVSAASVYRWSRMFESAGHDERSLAPDVAKRGNAGVPRLDDARETIIEEAMKTCASNGEIVTIDDVTNEAARVIAIRNAGLPSKDHLRQPHRSTVARRLTAQERDNGDRDKSDRQYGKTPYPLMPLEEAEMDGTRTDFLVLDDRDDLPLGRLYSMWCLDRATRYPLGYYSGFEPNSYYAVMACLFHAIWEKGNIKETYGTEHDWLAYGKMAKLIVDNAKCFIGKDLIDACRQLGIVLQFAPVRTPQFKATIERFLGTLNTMMFHQIPGTTFSNPQQRGAYDSVGQACVYLSQVDHLIHTGIVDMYAERFHTGLRGIPARRWERALENGFFPTLPESAERLHILLGRVAQRTVHHYGIDLFWLRYNCPELASIRRHLKRGEQVGLKYDPGNLSRIYVWHPFEKRYVDVPALDRDYTQYLSLWKHKIIVRATLQEHTSVDRAALGRARQKIQTSIQAGRDRKRISSRVQQGRWTTNGQSVTTMQPTTEASVEPTPVPPARDALYNEVPLFPDASTDQMSDTSNGWELTFSPSRKGT